MGESSCCLCRRQTFSKKLTINIGLEGRALAGYNRMGYSPILFNFYNIESSSNSNIFTYDAFLSYKIRLLRASSDWTISTVSMTREDNIRLPNILSMPLQFGWALTGHLTIDFNNLELLFHFLFYVCLFFLNNKLSDDFLF
jgi:hypothetical protein